MEVTLESVFRKKREACANFTVLTYNSKQIKRRLNAFEDGGLCQHRRSAGSVAAQVPLFFVGTSFSVTGSLNSLLRREEMWCGLHVPLSYFEVVAKHSLQRWYILRNLLLVYLFKLISSEGGGWFFGSSGACRRKIGFGGAEGGCLLFATREIFLFSLVTKQQAVKY